MSRDDRREKAEARRRVELCEEEALLACGAGGVCNAGLITLLAAADAFAARLATSHQHAAELSALHVRHLGLMLADMQPTRSLKSVEVGVQSSSQVRQAPQPSAFYGAPVVT